MSTEQDTARVEGYTYRFVSVRMHGSDSNWMNILGFLEDYKNNP